MRLLLMIFSSSILFLSPSWQTNMEKAIQQAQQENKNILLNFAGSDWCGPCIILHKEIFDSNIFEQYAKDHLVLVKADFPRLKKNQLSKEQQKLNDKLAEKYNKDGIFPLTVLLTPDGKVLKKWEGLPRVSPDEFTSEIKQLEHGIK